MATHQPPPWSSNRMQMFTIGYSIAYITTIVSLCFLLHTNDFTGLSGQVAILTPPTIRWYSAVIENNRNKYSTVVLR